MNYKIRKLNKDRKRAQSVLKKGNFEQHVRKQGEKIDAWMKKIILYKKKS